jgi:uncharacterized protein (TIGR00730 family)
MSRDEEPSSEPPHENASGDPDRALRIQKILESSSYIRADEDTAFLGRDELRHVRLELEYLKAELGLREHDIRSTVVLFGGTRIIEPEAARQEVEALAARLQEAPNDALLQRKKRIADRLLAKSRYYEVARTFARIASEDNLPSEFVILTGGGPGIMEAGNRGAFEAGRPTVGLNIGLAREQAPNPYITPELCFQFRYFAVRKLHFLMRAKALVAFPGGYGTFDELFDALCLVQTRKMKPIPIVLVGEEFWRSAFNAQYLADEGVIAPEDTELFHFAETAEEIWAYIAKWYEGQGE